MYVLAVLFVLKLYSCKITLKAASLWIAAFKTKNSHERGEDMTLKQAYNSRSIDEVTGILGKMDSEAKIISAEAQI